MLWLLAIVLIVVGIVGTVMPAVPGPVLVFAGLLAAAWADGFTRVGAGTLIVLGVMTALSYLIDLAAMVLGVQRAGASRRAVVGAALGLLAGLPFGLPGLLLGPFVGAALAELTVRRDIAHAGRAGAAAWVGLLVGSILKLALVFGMIGLFVAVYLLG